jgi:hypothetical protein
MDFPRLHVYYKGKQKKIERAYGIFMQFNKKTADSTKIFDILDKKQKDLQQFKQTGRTGYASISILLYHIPLWIATIIVLIFWKVLSKLS